MSDLAGKAAVVTGASSGIGNRTAQALANEGVNVALAAPESEEAELEALAEDLETAHGVETLVSVTDVSREGDVVSMIEATVDAFGGLDVAVSNAGIGNPGTIDETTTEEYRRTMGVNVDGMYFTARESLPHLRESAGNLIFLGSSSSEYPRPGSAIYAASKWWTRGFALSVAGTVGGDGVAVTLVNPSAVRTDIIVDGKPPLKERYAEGEAIEPETVAEAIVFAAGQSPPNAISEVDVYHRERLGEL